MSNTARLFAMACLMLAAGTTRAVAQDLNSANYLMPGCEAFVAQNSNSGIVFQAGMCAGQVQGVLDTAESVHMVCSPPQVTLGQAVRVVVQFIDARPAQMHQGFSILALMAMIKAWPCK